MPCATSNKSSRSATMDRLGSARHVEAQRLSRDALDEVIDLRARNGALERVPEWRQQLVPEVARFGSDQPANEAADPLHLHGEIRDGDWLPGVFRQDRQRQEGLALEVARRTRRDVDAAIDDPARQTAAAAGS